ncbi:MAG: hypothetical protein HFE58_08030, partial [Firmicutes bacterium]|nr:hypothetical protein [Bacillota bacterium]
TEISVVIKAAAFVTGDDATIVTAVTAEASNSQAATQQEVTATVTAAENNNTITLTIETASGAFADTPATSNFVVKDKDDATVNVTNAELTDGKVVLTIDTITSANAGNLTITIAKEAFTNAAIVTSVTAEASTVTA